MKKYIGRCLIIGACLFTACGSQSTENATTSLEKLKAERLKLEENYNSEMAADTTPIKTYDISLVVNKKDPTCGMPVTAGISDTAHYKNLVLGFCSSECKSEFVKNPEASLAAAEIKK